MFLKAPFLEQMLCTNAIPNLTNINEKYFSVLSKTLRVWELDLPNRKIRPTDCNMGQLKRIIKCIKVVNHSVFPILAQSFTLFL